MRSFPGLVPVSLRAPPPRLGALQRAHDEAVLGAPKRSCARIPLLPSRRRLPLLALPRPLLAFRPPPLANKTRLEEALLDGPLNNAAPSTKRPLGAWAQRVETVHAAREVEVVRRRLHSAPRRDAGPARAVTGSQG